MNSLSSPQIITHVSDNVCYTPYSTLWIPNTSRLIVSGENPRKTGVIAIYDLDITDKKQSLKLLSKATKLSGIKTSTFGASPTKDSPQLATGDFNGGLAIWDLEKMNHPIYDIKKAHDSIINSIDGIGGLDIGSGAPELVTGSRDGSVKVWDPRSDKSVAELVPCNKSKKRDCWSVTFGNSYNNNNRMIASGYDNGDIKIFDLRTNNIFYETNVKNGVCCLEFDRPDIKLNKLVATTLESNHIVFDMKTKHIVEGFANKSMKDHKNNSTIWQCRHLPQNRDIWITATGNGSINVWKYVYPNERFIEDDNGYKKGVMGDIELIATNKIATQPIISWNWNRNKIGLASMVSLDQSVQIVIVTKLNKQ